jgi:hypothetical protein
VRRFDGAAHGSETAVDAVATSRSVYFCGAGVCGAGGRTGGPLIGRYSSAGVRRWVTYLSPTRAEAGFFDLQQSPSGVVACGCVFRKTTGLDWATACYRSGGTVRWARFFSSAGLLSDLATALDVDGDGAVYVTGVTDEAADGQAVRTICYGPTGATRWGTGASQSWNGPGGGDDSALDVEVSTDAVWVSGSTPTAAGDDDLLVLKYEK